MKSINCDICGKEVECNGKLHTNPEHKELSMWIKAMFVQPLNNNTTRDSFDLCGECYASLSTTIFAEPKALINFLNLKCSEKKELTKTKL